MDTDFEERMHHHLYSNEGREEQCKRICKLEELATKMAVVIGVYDLTMGYYNDENPPALPLFAAEMKELDIEVPSLGFELPNDNEAHDV